MGMLFSRLRKKKETTEILQELDVEIKNCINFRLENQESQRRWVGRLTLWGIIFYVVLALLYYLIYFPVGWVQRIVYSGILIVAPVILILALRRSLMWYYSRKITYNEEKLLLLKEEKEKILEEVMENETYKKAKEILEKFDADRFKTMTPPRLGATSNPSTPGSELRQRKGGNVTPKAPPPPTSAALAIGPPPSIPSTPSASACPNGVVLRPPINTPLRMGAPSGGTPARPIQMLPAGPLSANFPNRGPAPMMARPPVLPRPVLQPDRGVLDRMVEYLVGDGPTNRYALICRRCHRHNGMALKEEFEYLAFHCAYCQFLNPAKRKRPCAPRLPESNPPSARESDAGSESDGNVGTPPPLKPVVGKPSASSSETSVVDENVDHSEDKATARTPVTGEAASSRTDGSAVNRWREESNGETDLGAGDEKIEAQQSDRTAGEEEEKGEEVGDEEEGEEAAENVVEEDAVPRSSPMHQSSAETLNETEDGVDESTDAMEVGSTS